MKTMLLQMQYINHRIFCDPNLYIASLVDKPTPIFPPICMYQAKFGNCCLKMINIFTKYNTHIYSKIPFEIQEITITMHICPPKYEYCIFGLKTQSHFLTQMKLLQIHSKNPLHIL